MRVAANLSWLFSEAGSTVADRCAAARAAGFTAVESGWPGDTVSAETYRDALQSAGLTQVLLGCLHGDVSAGECGFAAEPGQEQRFLESLKTCLQYAAVIGCHKVHVPSGRRVSSCSSEDQEATLVSNLRSAVPLLQQYDVTALIEPCSPVSLAGYFLNDFDTGERVVKAVGSESVALELDLFHLQMVAGNLTNNIRKLLPITKHVQVAQAPHRQEPSLTGEVDFRHVFRVLQEEGYTGFVGCEYEPSCKTEDTLGWVTEYGLQF